MFASSRWTRGSASARRTASGPPHSRACTCRESPMRSACHDARSRYPSGASWTGGTARSRSAISSSSGSRHIAIGTSGDAGQVGGRTQGAPFFQLEDNFAGDLGRRLADRLKDNFLKLPDQPHIDQGPADLQLQPELLPDLGGEPQDDIHQRAAIGARLSRLGDGPRQLLVDHLLNPLKPLRAVEFLLDNGAGVFERQDTGVAALLPFEPLVDRRLGNLKMS